MAVHFFDILGYIMMYLGYPFLDKSEFDFFETDMEFNPRNKSETIRLHGNYRNFSYKYCTTNSINETCYEKTEDYPSAITFFWVSVWCHWELALYSTMPVGVVVALIVARCKDGKCSKLIPFSMLFLILSCEFINAVGFILYVQLIGRSVGFKWKDLTYFYYFGVISPTKLIIAIICVKKGCKFLINKTRKLTEDCGMTKKQPNYEEFTNELETSSYWVNDCQGVTNVESDCQGVTNAESDCQGVTNVESDCQGVTNT